MDSKRLVLQLDRLFLANALLLVLWYVFEKEWQAHTHINHFELWSFGFWVETLAMATLIGGFPAWAVDYGCKRAAELERQRRRLCWQFMGSQCLGVLAVIFVMGHGWRPGPLPPIWQAGALSPVAAFLAGMAVALVFLWLWHLAISRILSKTESGLHAGARLF